MQLVMSVTAFVRTVRVCRRLALCRISAPRLSPALCRGYAAAENPEEAEDDEAIRREYDEFREQFRQTRDRFLNEWKENYRLEKDRKTAQAKEESRLVAELHEKALEKNTLYNERMAEERCRFYLKHTPLSFFGCFVACIMRTELRRSYVKKVRK